jgi:hypothetical protein
MKRQQKPLSPSQVLAEEVEENNVETNKENNERRKEETKIERKRVSFDLRTDLHKELKLQSIVQDKNIYILIEEALDRYLKDMK